jgi:aminoglycoside phosphotransferase (APT) family kinase protein
LGRNVVFLSPTVVIKLGPPEWQGEMLREAAALHFVAGQLPIAIPTSLATGVLDGWEYVVQQRLPGTNLRDLWPQLDETTKHALAYQHGELMKAIHQLPVQDAPALLHFDWAEMLALQHESCAHEMRAAGLEGALAEKINAYLAATPWESEAGEEALLHGDLNSLNFLVTEANDRWEITGLIDWGDVKIGPPSHELISPAMHMYIGHRTLLRQWYAGYALLAQNRLPKIEHIVMARAMLYYQAHFVKSISKIPASVGYSDWATVASTFLQMRA